MRLWSESWAAIGGPALEAAPKGLGAPAQQKAQAQDAPSTVPRPGGLWYKVFLFLKPPFPLCLNQEILPRGNGEVGAGRLSEE